MCLGCIHNHLVSRSNHCRVFKLWCSRRLCAWSNSFHLIIYIYMLPLGSIISKHYKPSLLCYADDPHLYLSIKPEKTKQLNFKHESVNYRVGSRPILSVKCPEITYLWFDTLNQTKLKTFRGTKHLWSTFNQVELVKGGYHCHSTKVHKAIGSWNVYLQIPHFPHTAHTCILKVWSQVSHDTPSPAASPTPYLLRMLTWTGDPLVPKLSPHTLSYIRPNLS